MSLNPLAHSSEASFHVFTRDGMQMSPHGPRLMLNFAGCTNLEPEQHKSPETVLRKPDLSQLHVWQRYTSWPRLITSPISIELKKTYSIFRARSSASPSSKKKRAPSSK